MNLNCRLCENIDLFMEELFNFVIRAQERQEEEREEKEGEKRDSGELAADIGNNRSIFLSIYPSINQLIYPSIRLSIYLSINVERITLKLLRTHLLTSDKISSTQYIVFYLASKEGKVDSLVIDRRGPSQKPVPPLPRKTCLLHNDTINRGFLQPSL